MSKKIAPSLTTSEIIIGTAANSYKIARLVKAGQLVKIASKIYSFNVTEEPEIIVRRNYLSIVRAFFPGAIISHRSALETKVTSDGYFFVSHTRSGRLELPGLTVVTLKSEMKLDGTSTFMGDLFISQRERAFLECLQQGKTTKGPVKILDQAEIEKKLDQICRVHGEDGLNQIRDQARKVATKLGFKKEFQKLNKIISAILTTHPSSILVSPEARARSLNLPYDPERLKRFDVLAEYLRDHEFKTFKRVFKSNEEFENQCFFEAYFSNYIEGTRFELAEAKKIVFEGKIPKNRPDAHDVLGTYQLLVNKQLMKAQMIEPGELIKNLKLHHRFLMQGHPQLRPSEFKEERNQAGSTLFVEPEVVMGTLVKGMENFYLLQDAFKQSLYIMFLIAEVHPFDDGNGRVARLFMNSVLFQNSLEKIIVPNVFRDDYMGSLKKLTKQDDPTAFVKAMMRCHEFSAKIDYSTFEKALADLTLANAFLDPEEGKLF